MLVMEKINADPQRKAAFWAEQEQLRLSLLKRAELFMKEAKEIDLSVCPFDAGFFVTVPTVKAEEVAAELRKSDLFVVPVCGWRCVPFRKKRLPGFHRRLKLRWM